MVIDGKKRHVVIVDFNSNGRYDDPSKIDDSVQLSDGTVYPTIGDMLYIIDPEMAQPHGYASPYDPSTNNNLHYVGKLVNLDGRFIESHGFPQWRRVDTRAVTDSGRSRDQLERGLPGDCLR